MCSRGRRWYQDSRRSLTFIFWSAGRYIVGSTVLLILGGIAGTVVPLFTAWALNDGLLAEPIGKGVLIIGSVCALLGYLVVACADAGRSFLAYAAGVRAAGALRIRAFDVMVANDLAQHRAAHTGNQASFILNDAAAIATVPSTVIDKVLGGIVSAAAALIAMWALSPLLTLYAFMFSLPLVLLMRGLSTKIEHRTLRLYESLSVLQATIGDLLTFDHVLLAKIFGRESDSSLRLASASDGEVAAAISLRRAGIIRFALISAIMLSGPVLLYLVLGFTGGISEVQAGTLLAFTGLHARLPFVLIGLLSTAANVRATQTVLSSVLDVIDSPTAARGAPPLVSAFNKHDLIVVDDVSFSYDSDGDVLSSINLTVHEQDKIHLTGRSGTGKSTLARLIAGVESPRVGSVRKIQRASGELCVDLVPQNSYFFPGSVRDNLLYARETCTDLELWEALAAVCLDDRVKESAVGLDTVLGNGGVSLSGGERQRLAIARSILRDGDVIILDEATNALDRETEARLLTDLWLRWRRKALVIITHHELMLPSGVREFNLRGVDAEV